MNKTINENDAAFLNGPKGEDDAREIGNFFYDLKPARDAGVGLTEETIDYIVDVKGEPEWLREFRKKCFPCLQQQATAYALGRGRAQGDKLRPNSLLPRFRRRNQADVGRGSGQD
jgi:hypothetical protein